MSEDVASQIENQKSKICFVTGATGVVGVPLVHELVKNGHAVKVLVRGEISPTLFPPKVTVVRGDLSNTEALEKGADGADWVFHLAAKLHINNPDQDLQREYEEINVAGTEKLIVAAKKQKIEKFIFFSTISVYGASDGKQIFDESDPIAPAGFYAVSKAAAEKLVLAEDFGVVLRLAAVYGSRMKGNFARLVVALRRGRFIFIGDGFNRRTLIHQEDAAQAAILAAMKAPCGSIYNVTDGEVHSFNEVVRAMSEALKKNQPKTRLPLAPVSLGIGLVEDLGKVLSLESPINRALLEKLIEDVAISGFKIKSELGFRPHFDLASGWRQTVADNGLRIAK